MNNFYKNGRLHQIFQVSAGNTRTNEKGWTFHYAKAIFSGFAGRTVTDPRFNEYPTPCKCGHPDLSSRHIIEQCPIFDQRRQKIWNGHAAPPDLTSDMLLDKGSVRIISEAPLVCPNGC
jgi:hypothetical protein